MSTTRGPDVDRIIYCDHERDSGMIALFTYSAATCRRFCNVFCVILREIVIQSFHCSTLEAIAHAVARI